MFILNFLIEWTVFDGSYIMTLSKINSKYVIKLHNKTKLNLGEKKVEIQKNSKRAINPHDGQPISFEKIKVYFV